MLKFIPVVSWPGEWSGENLTILNIVTPGDHGMQLHKNISVDLSIFPTWTWITNASPWPLGTNWSCELDWTELGLGLGDLGNKGFGPGLDN